LYSSGGLGIAGEDLGEVKGLYAGVLAVERALEVHQAGVVAGGADFGAGAEDGGGFFGEHGGRDVGIFDGEGSAEAATLFEVGEFDEVDAADVLEEAHGAVAKVKVAEAVAAGVVGDAMGVEGSDVFEAEAVGEELGKLVDLGEEVGDGGLKRGIVEMRCHLGVVVAHHADAGGRGDDDGFGVLELVDEPAKEGVGLGLVARVVVHLAAAGLAEGKFDRVAEAFEDADDGLAGAGKKRVVIAGDEERDAQGKSLRAGFKNSIEILFPYRGFRQLRWYALAGFSGYRDWNEGNWERILSLA
jgi:hypothetical protein